MWASQVALSGKEPSCQCGRCKRCGFDPWVRKIPWRRAWQSTPVVLPGESHGQKGLAGYNQWGRKESDTTEATQHTTHGRLKKSSSDPKQPHASQSLKNLNGEVLETISVSLEFMQ